MLRYFHNFPAIGCFSNFTFTDTHTSSLNLNSPFPRYYKISQRKNSNRNLEVSSCNTASSPLSLYSPSSSCLAGFCVHLLPQPPVPPPLIPLEILPKIPILTGIRLLSGEPEKGWQEAMTSGFLLWDYACSLDHYDENCVSLSLLIERVEKKGQGGKNKEQNTGMWESPGNAGAHHKVVALLERAQNCRACPGL